MCGKIIRLVLSSFGLLMFELFTLSKFERVICDKRLSNCFKQHPDPIVRNIYFYTKDNYSKFKENGTDFTLLIADTSMFVLNFMIECRFFTSLQYKYTNLVQY